MSDGAGDERHEQRDAWPRAARTSGGSTEATPGRQRGDDRGHARDGLDRARQPDARSCPTVGRRHPVKAGEAASKVIHRAHPGGLGGGAGRGSGWPARPGCWCPGDRRSGGSGGRRSRRGSPRHAVPRAVGGRRPAGRGRHTRRRGRRPAPTRSHRAERAFSAPRLIVESGPPHPRRRVADRRSAAEKLGIRLGDRVARDLGVAGEGVDRAPQPVGIGPVEGFDVLSARRPRRRCCPSPTQGAILTKR